MHRVRERQVTEAAGQREVERVRAELRLALVESEHGEQAAAREHSQAAVAHAELEIRITRERWRCGRHALAVAGRGAANHLIDSGNRNTVPTMKTWRRIAP